MLLFDGISENTKFEHLMSFYMVLGSATTGQQKQPVRVFEANLYERPDVKPIKVKMPIPLLTED